LNDDSDNSVNSDSGIWVALIGSINSQLEFELTVKWLYERKKEKRIEKIIFSTWDYCLTPNVCGFLENYGVIYRGIPAIKNQNKEIGFNSREIQELQLKYCLEIMPENVTVLKCRTDYSLIWLNKNQFTFFSKKYLTAKNNWEHSPRNRIITSANYIPIIPPFRFGDLQFVGSKSDLDLLVDLTNTELTGFDFSPDDRLMRIHATKIKIIDQGMRYISFFALEKYNMENELCFPKILNMFYAAYIRILIEEYYLDDITYAEEEIDTFDDFFFKGISSNFINKRVGLISLDRLIKYKLKSSPGYVSFLREYEKMEDYSYLVNCNYTLEDWDELVSWGKVNIKDCPDSWVKYPRIVDTNTILTIHSLFDEDEIYKRIERKCAQIKTIEDVEYVGSSKLSNYKLYIECLIMKIRYGDKESFCNYLNEFFVHHIYFNDFFNNLGIVYRFCELNNLLPIILKLCLLSNDTSSFNRRVRDYYNLLGLSDDPSTIDSFYLALLSKKPKGFLKLMPRNEKLIVTLAYHRIFNISPDVRELIIKELDSNSYILSKKSIDAILMGVQNGWVDDKLQSHSWIETFRLSGVSIPSLNMVDRTCPLDINQKYTEVWKNRNNISVFSLVDALEDLASKGHIESMVNLGIIFRDNDDLKDFSKAMYWFEEAANRGNGWAKEEIYNSLLNTKAHRELRLKYLFYFSEGGDSNATAKIGRAYRDGRGVQQDLKKAVEYMELGYQNGAKWIYNELESLRQK